jgi:hypothetical protein
LTTIKNNTVQIQRKKHFLRILLLNKRQKLAFLAGYLVEMVSRLSDYCPVATRVAAELARVFPGRTRATRRLHRFLNGRPAETAE